MTNLEMVQVVFTEQPDATAIELAESVEGRFGVKIEPKFIPLYLATIRDKRLQAIAREKRQAESKADCDLSKIQAA
jgi:hypothetical protein